MFKQATLLQLRKKKIMPTPLFTQENLGKHEIKFGLSYPLTGHYFKTFTALLNTDFLEKVEMQNQLRSKEHSGGEERRGCSKKTSKI